MKENDILLAMIVAIAGYTIYRAYQESSAQAAPVPTPANLPALSYVPPVMTIPRDPSIIWM